MAWRFRRPTLKYSVFWSITIAYSTEKHNIIIFYHSIFIFCASTNALGSIDIRIVTGLPDLFFLDWCRRTECALWSIRAVGGHELLNTALGHLDVLFFAISSCLLHFIIHDRNLRQQRHSWIPISSKCLYQNSWGIPKFIKEILSVQCCLFWL